eukprot:gene5060-10132_t
MEVLHRIDNMKKSLRNLVNSTSPNLFETHIKIVFDEVFMPDSVDLASSNGASRPIDVAAEFEVASRQLLSEIIMKTPESQLLDDGSTVFVLVSLAWRVINVYKTSVHRPILVPFLLVEDIMEIVCVQYAETLWKLLELVSSQLTEGRIERGNTAPFSLLSPL